MRDIDVRGALRTSLREEHSRDAIDTVFVDELDLCGEVRVDVAVLNGSLSGYELKSERDTLRRLPKQVELYSKMLDYAFLVVAENHQAEALKMLPEWWGVISATAIADGDVSLTPIRPAQFNPAIDPTFLVRLLWRDELLDELTRLGLDRGVRTKPRRVLCDRLVANVDLHEVRSIVRRRLKSRSGWRAEPALS